MKDKTMEYIKSGKGLPPLKSDGNENKSGITKELRKKEGYVLKKGLDLQMFGSQGTKKKS